jgi:hypothetical protein
VNEVFYLAINGKDIIVNEMAQAYIAGTVSGMLESLDGVGKVTTAQINIKSNIISVNVNSCLTPTNIFASKILISTIKGMASFLKGVQEINTLDLRLKAPAKLASKDSTH